MSPICFCGKKSVAHLAVTEKIRVSFCYQHAADWEGSEPYKRGRRLVEQGQRPQAVALFSTWFAIKRAARWA